jgi:hypothetical protein
MDQSQHCATEIYYMIGVVVVAAGGYIAIQQIRRHIRGNDRGGRQHRSRRYYGALDTASSSDTDDVSTNTTPRTVASTATQYTVDDEMSDCVVTSPFGSSVHLDIDGGVTDTGSTTSASLVSRGSASPAAAPGWFSRLW